MAELLHEHSARVTKDGITYIGRIYGEARDDGTWIGWLEFMPESAPVTRVPKLLRTGQETSQPDRRAVEYWASGLEAVYLEGALERAKRGD